MACCPSTPEARHFYAVKVSDYPPVQVELSIKGPDLDPMWTTKIEPWPIIMDLTRYVSYVHSCLEREGPLQAELHLKFLFPRLIRPPSPFNIGLRRWRVKHSSDPFCSLRDWIIMLNAMLTLQYRTIAKTLEVFDGVADAKKFSDQILAVGFTNLRYLWLRNLFNPERFRGLFVQMNSREPDIFERNAFRIFFDGFDRLCSALERRHALGGERHTFKVTEAYRKLRRESRELHENEVRFAARFRDVMTVLVDEIVAETARSCA